ncbi:hypothetical protein BCR44DRAFT_1440940 [Catenaria anguillulae PL171]|uniref:Uncharacterized protein n=1 Tax=Catenaria anguillulae PL171 TaxID=765915 RepID=A0A1Y2HC90_9FUNG|nr:hypothetical protein BCR44DRAFT_1440940 [Catenaria anguillulae PL171]
MDSAADPVVLATVPPESAAQVLVSLLIRRISNQRHVVEQLTLVRLLALLAGMIPHMVSFSDLQAVTSAIGIDNGPHRHPMISTYLSCLAFATLTFASPKSTQAIAITADDHDDSDNQQQDTHWTRDSLASYTLRLPPLATLLHLASSSTSPAASSSTGGWPAAEHTWCTWLHISPPLPGLLGGGTMTGDRVMKWTSWVIGELAARDAVVGAATRRGAQVELMVALIRERKVAGPATSSWVLDYLLAVDQVMSAADVELVEIFVDSGIMSGTCPPLDPDAVRAHTTATSPPAKPMPLSTVLLTYYVLMLTTRLGPWAHSSHFPVEFVHSLPVPRALKRAKGTHVEYKLRASLGVVGEYLALMQAVDCSGYVEDADGCDEAGVDGEVDSVHELIARGRVSQWTRKFALDPIHVAHTTLAFVSPTGLSWSDMLENPMSVFSSSSSALAGMFATASLANMSLLTLDFLLAASASLVRSRAYRAFGTYIDAQQHEHDAGKLEWQVGEAVAGVKAAVMNKIAEQVLLVSCPEGGGGTDDVVLGWMNRMYMKDGMLVGRCVGLGVDPRTVPSLVKLTSFHVFLQQYTSTLQTHPHLTLYLLAALCYEYPLLETLQLATKQILPMLPVMFSSSLDPGHLVAPMGVDVQAAATPRLTRFQVVLKAVVAMVRAFPEDVFGSVQTILLETKQGLTQRLMQEPDTDQRAQLVKCYDGLMETVEEVMQVARKGVMHCGR